MSINEQFTKTVDEDYTITIDFSDRVPSGETLSSATVAAVDLTTGSTVSASLLGSTSATISSSNASVLVQNGTHGREYSISFLATFSDSSTAEKILTMRVRD